MHAVAFPNGEGRNVYKFRKGIPRSRSSIFVSIKPFFYLIHYISESLVSKIGMLLQKSKNWTRELYSPLKLSLFAHFPVYCSFRHISFGSSPLPPPVWHSIHSEGIWQPALLPSLSPFMTLVRCDTSPTGQILIRLLLPSPPSPLSFLAKRSQAVTSARLPYLHGGAEKLLYMSFSLKENTYIFLQFLFFFSLLRSCNASF